MALSRPLTGISLVAPSVLGVDQTFSLRIKLLTVPFFAKAECYKPSPAVDGRYNVSPRGITYMDNVLPRWKGTLFIEGGQDCSGPDTFRFTQGDGPYPGDDRPIGRIHGISFSAPGTRFIRVHDPTSGMRGTSNAIKVMPEPPMEKLFWGDIHSQTFFSDGLRCPEELYSFAREEAFLDIFALSDHSESLTDRQWDYFVAVTNDFYEPRCFVTFIGLEWTSAAWGHRNVYYPGASGPILRSTDPVYGQLPELFKAAREHKALVVPHHSANTVMGVNWSLGHDPEVERLVEIYSIWGNSERSEGHGNSRPIRVMGGEKAGQHVLDALALGRRFGFVGGGDIHDGRPGDEMHNLQKQVYEYPDTYRQGLIGVWAADLTREAVFEALRNRRVFATTNVRVFLKFSIDGHPMGSEIDASNDLSISVEAASENPIARVDLVRNGQDVRSFQPHRKDVCLRMVEPPPANVDCYYTRLIREDGEMAWSSPIWVSRKL